MNNQVDTNIDNTLTVIIPLHALNNETEKSYLKNAVNSVIENRKNSGNNAEILFVCSPATNTEIEKIVSDVQLTNYNILINDTGNIDYCSQINFAVDYVNTKWFSILEFDDIYTTYWFKSFNDYLYSKEDVSLFLPINVQYEENTPEIRQFCNEIVWANEFSKEIGYIDFECLENFVGFNLTGGIFNKADFIVSGRFKPSIDIAFNYEFLLRLTHNHFKVFVIPKEGYIHCLNRNNSLTDEYSKRVDDTEIKRWFELAKREYPYLKDRNSKPCDIVEQLK